MLRFPQLPEVPDSQRASAQGHLRYEDVSQDGRVMLLALPHTLGLAVWQNLLANHPATRAGQTKGLTPILTRFTIDNGLDGEPGPVSVRRPLEIAGGFQLAHTVDPGGEPNRITLDVWSTVQAPRGRTHGPPPAGAGELVRVGRVYAEHVFTRLFAEPHARKVTRLDIEGTPAVPPAVVTWKRPDDVLELPEGARWLDDELLPDSVQVHFGLMHSDSNQHVNSLAYPRLFEEAVLRRLAAHGRSTKVLARFAEITYRKPCFAGDRMRLILRAFALGERVGAVGAFLHLGDAALGDRAALPRAHCYLRMVLGE